MADALYIAATALNASLESINVAAGNTSNADSVAYKARMLVTTDSFYTTLKKTGLADATSGFSSPSLVQRGTGTKISGIAKIMTQGSRKETGNPLHLYIAGGGYFAVNIPGNDGKPAYTRVGAFRLSNDRRLVTLDQGYSLVGDITIPDGIDEADIEITETGSIINRKTQEDTGLQIQLYTFANEGALEDIGGGLAIESPQSGEGEAAIPGSAQNVGKLIAKNLEMSNINKAQSLIDVISAQRAYELNLKIIAAVNEIEQETIKNIT